MNWSGIIIGISVFLMIGLFHPIVIKAEYYLGKGCWPLFAVAGAIGIVGSLLTSNTTVSILLGVFAFSCFWSIIELYEQEKRVERGWFPANPKRTRVNRSANEAK